MTASEKHVSTSPTQIERRNPRTKRKRGLNKVEAAVGNSARWMVRFVIIAMISFGFWAAATELPELAYAEGVIEPSGPLSRVEHLDGGVAANIQVAEGQFVEEGETLVVLSAQPVDADARRLRLRASSLERTVSRLETILERIEGYSGTVSLAYGITNENRLRAQLQTFETSYRRLRGRLTDINNSIAIRESLHANSIEREAAYDGELEASRTLWERRRITRSEYGTIEARKIDIVAERLRAAVSLSDAKRERSEIKHTMAEYIANTREELLSELEVAEEERAFTLQAIADNEARRARLAITSPIKGVVQRIEIASLGEVVEPGGLVAEVLPTEEMLVAEIKLRPDDIGHVEIGDAVELRSTTFSAKKFGILEGKILRVAPNSQKNDAGEVFFPVKIALAKQFIGNGDQQQRLSPGMEVNAAIFTNTRSVLDYLLDPLLSPLRRAFGER